MVCSINTRVFFVGNNYNSLVHLKKVAGKELANRISAYTHYYLIYAPQPRASKYVSHVLNRRILTIRRMKLLFLVGHISVHVAHQNIEEANVARN